MNNRGQIAVFVIIAIIIVSVIALFFLIDRTPEVQKGQDFDNPESVIDSCVKDVAEDGINILLENGGFLDPKNSVLYKEDEVTYLCKNVNYYQPCVNQHPLYINKVNEQLKEYLNSRIGDCFSILEEELEKRNYVVSSQGLDINTKLKPSDVVEINVKRDLSMSKGNVIKTFEEFNVFVRSPIYDLLFIANEIVDQEARNCFFSNDGFMILYPEFDIRKDFAADGESKVYTITDKETGDGLQIAIRGCVIPAGF